jgi:ribA/ribD-fused uncharacterized protein
MSEGLEKFYKGRNKNPQLFTYDDDGNLIEKNKDGEVIKTIALPNYRSPTFEEFDEMEKVRIERIAIAQKEFEDARKALRDILLKPDVIDSDVLRANRKAREADAKLQDIRFQERVVVKVEGVEIRELDFDQPNEKRKLPYEISIFESRPFKLQEMYVRVGKAAEKPLISVAEAKAADTVPVILFAEPDTNDYGFLSLKWVVDIEFKGTIYNSAWQAIAAEIAKSFNDQENLNKIMLAESPDAIDYSVDDVPGDKEVNETKWADLTKQLLYDVNLAKFNQYPELAARLLETRSAQLGAYEPDDNLIGIGISLDNIQSRNPVSWTGQNLLGKALMDIRDKIRVEKEAATAVTAVTEAVIPKRKKPVVASTQQVAQVTAPVAEPVAAPVAAVRVPRRRPVVAAPLVEPKQETETETEAEAEAEAE